MPDTERDESIARFFTTANDSSGVNGYKVNTNEKSVISQNTTHPEDLEGVNQGPQTNYTAVMAMWDQITKNNRAA